MANMEKVIRWLEACSTGCEPGCPYEYENMVHMIECKADLMRDALELLKTQEAREPHYTTLRYLVNGKEVVVQHPECPRCVEKGLVLWDAAIEKGSAFCKRCGQAVKWE